MAIPWNESVRTAGRLRVHATRSLRNGGWQAVVQQAIRDFNRLSRTHHLRVTLSATDSASEAEVIVKAVAQAIDETYDGVAIRHAFDGTRLHGHTSLVNRDGALERALVFLPSMPQVNTPSGVREVGPGVKRLIAVHELVHACGLSNDDHSSDDLFAAYPTVDPGTRPDGDRVRVSYSVRMPPLVLGVPTIAKVRENWQ